MNCAQKLINDLARQHRRPASVDVREATAVEPAEAVFFTAPHIDVVAASWHLRELARAEEIHQRLLDADYPSRVVVIGAGAGPGPKLVDYLGKLNANLPLVDGLDGPHRLAEEYRPKNEPWYQQHAHGRKGRRF
jgi:hypothetical protein